MDTLSIERFIAPYQKQKMFKGVFPCDSLPKKFTLPASFVINLSAHNECGSHWVALYINNDRQAFYFDSFGFGIRNKFIRSFLKVHCKTFTCNTKQLQHVMSNKCGKFCCVFITSILNNARIDDFLNKFSVNLFVNDIVIENMYKYLEK